MSDWLNMGGYAFFVWSSYGIFTVIMVYLLISSVIRHRAARQARSVELEVVVLAALKVACRAGDALVAELLVVVGVLDEHRLLDVIVDQYFPT